MDKVDKIVSSPAGHLSRAAHLSAAQQPFYRAQRSEAHLSPEAERRAFIARSAFIK